MSEACRLPAVTEERLPPERVAGRAVTPARAQWRELARPTPEPGRFDPSAVGDLPEPACRWLTHAIAPGTLLARTVVLEMEGRFRLGPWLPMRAVQVLSPPHGLVWAARIGWGPLSFRGYDRFGGDAGNGGAGGDRGDRGNGRAGGDGGAGGDGDLRGEMAWRLFGLLPVVHMAGPHIDRSAAGRLAAEAMWAPGSFLGPEVSWQPGATPDVVTAQWRIGVHRVPVDMCVGSGGALRPLTVHRWGNPGKQPWAEYPFGGAVEEESTFGGFTIPTRMTVGWFAGTDRSRQGAFFRFHVTAARHL